MTSTGEVGCSMDIPVSGVALTNRSQANSVCPILCHPVTSAIEHEKRMAYKANLVERFRNQWHDQHSGGDDWGWEESVRHSG